MKLKKTVADKLKNFKNRKQNFNKLFLYTFYLDHCQ